MNLFSKRLKIFRLKSNYHKWINKSRFRKGLQRLLIIAGIKFWIVFGTLLVICEFAIYPAVLLQCSWPMTENSAGKNETLRAIFLSDTHMLGPLNGHWFDKLRREWQMQRSFQTAMSFFTPDVVFFLGDLFDEGHFVTGKGFEDYVRRFHRLFAVPSQTLTFSLQGNHDMGFHNDIKAPENDRFNKAFNVDSVNFISLKGSKFILLNSMAMQMDDCFLCQPAINSLKKIADALQCQKNPETCLEIKDGLDGERQQPSSLYSSPILLQHFPMYRHSDYLCTGDDAAPVKDRTRKFNQTFDCLSKESSQLILELIQPRLIVAGHTHHHCVTKHEFPGKNEYKTVTEYSVPSFNWRNKNDPSFYLGIITPREHSLSKCYLPKESTVAAVYAFGGFILVFIWIIDLITLLSNKFKSGTSLERFWKGEHAV